MLTDRCNCCGMCCRSKVTAWVIGVTLFLFALVVGAILGALFSGFVLANIVVLVILGVALLLTAIFTALFARCRCEE